jgi:hypothetical protein
MQLWTSLPRELLRVTLGLLIGWGGAWPVIGSTGGLFSKADAREIRLDPKARSVYVISKAVRLGPLSIAKLKAIRST